MKKDKSTQRRMCIAAVNKVLGRRAFLEKSTLNHMSSISVIDTPNPRASHGKAFTCCTIIPKKQECFVLYIVRVPNIILQ